MAESLRDAIASAYASNPQITAERARLRQIDENVPIAASALRPHIDLTGDFTQQFAPGAHDVGRRWDGGAVFRQSIYEGGRVGAGISAAEAEIAAGRARLRATEYAVIVDTITAYADVLERTALVELNAGQVRVLGEQLQASQDRFEVGDLTRTDVAQSEARLAAARAGLQSAEAQLIMAEQAYRRLVGRAPVNLEPLPPLPPLPANDAEANDRAFAANPDLAAARFMEKASAEHVRVARAGRGPSVQVQAGAHYVHGTDTLSGLTGFTPSLGVSARMPLFSGGQIAAQVRQAQARQSEALENISRAERQLRDATTSAWAMLRTSEALIQSARAQIAANELAAEGVRQENMVGSRDVLDVLNAEQELLNAQVSLVEARRNHQVSAYQLFMLMGELETVLDDAPIGRYDAEANARRVRSKGWQEFGYDPDPRENRARDQAPAMIGPSQ